MKSQLLAILFLLASFFAQAQQVSEYNFNSLNTGNLHNQDGWKTIAQTAASSPDFVVDYTADGLVSPDGSLAVFYPHGGPGVGRTATRKSDSSFEFGFADGVVEVEVDMHNNWWGVFFGIGFDANNNGHIAPGLPSEPDDGGVYISCRNVPPALNKIVLPNGNELEFTADNSDWARYKMIMDFTANGGAGSISLFYKPEASGDWLPASEVQGANMGLIPGSGDKNDNTVWDGIFFHSQGGTGAFDNILIRQPDLSGLYQYINFPAIANKLTTAAPFQLEATASSGLSVEYEIMEGPATIDGDMLSLNGQAGMVKVKASQPGNGEYAPANDVINTFEVVDASAWYPALKVRRPAELTKVYMEDLQAVLFLAETSVEHPEVLSITSVEFSIDGQALTVLNNGNGYYAAKWTPPTFGNYTMQVKSTITEGNSTTKEINFEVTDQIEAFEVQTFAGETVTPDNQIVTGTFIFPTFVGSFKEINSILTLSCPPGGCDPYDRVSHVEIKDINGNWIEMYRYLTPFGVGCSDQTDVTDYASLLQGEVDMRYHCILWDKGVNIDILYEFVPGTPEYLYSSVTPIWRGEFSFGNMNNLQPVPVKQYTFPNDATAAHLKVITTGHNWGSNNTGNAAEFYHATHFIKVNDSRVHTQNLWVECNPNPAGCQPQSGTWYHPRAGWCPGSISQIFNFDMSQYILTPNFKLEYEFDPNYIDYCNAANPNCVSGVTCPDCEDTFSPILNVSTHMITFSNQIFVSTPERHISSFRIVPNPAQSNFRLLAMDAAKITNAKVEIISHTGQLIEAFNWDGQEKQIGVQHLKAGLYIVRITTEKGTEQKKLIVL